MPAPKGNQFALKYPSKEEREAVFADLITHLERGYHKDHFPLMDWDTVLVYAEKFPEDFPTDRIEQATRQGLLTLEQRGHAGLDAGGNFNASAWKFLMMNKSKWTLRQHVDGEQKHRHEVHDPSRLTDAELDQKIEERLSGILGDRPPAGKQSAKNGKQKRKGRTARRSKRA